MNTPSYATKEELIQFSLWSFAPILLYYVPLFLKLKASGNSWFIFIVGLIACILMFLWKVRVGETGHILVFGHDTGSRTRSGIFLMPSLFPFMRAFEVVIGWSVETPSYNHHGNTVSIQHYQDQRMPTYTVTTQTSLIGSMVGQFITNALSWLFNARDPDGTFKYYKYGGIIYVGCWVVAR